MNRSESLLIKKHLNGWPTVIEAGLDFMHAKTQGLFPLSIGGGWARRTYYRDNLIRVLCSDAGELSSSNRRFNNGHCEFFINRSFLYDMRHGNLLVVGVGLNSRANETRFGPSIIIEPKVIYVSEDLETPRCPSYLRSIRNAFRKALMTLKEKGIRVERIPQKLMNGFIANYNYQPNSHEAKELEAKLKAGAIRRVYDSLRS